MYLHFNTNFLNNQLKKIFTIGCFKKAKLSLEIKYFSILNFKQSCIENNNGCYIKVISQIHKQNEMKKYFMHLLKTVK